MEGGGRVALPGVVDQLSSACEGESGRIIINWRRLDIQNASNLNRQSKDPKRKSQSRCGRGAVTVPQ